jgi:hypothetical protein
MDHRTVFGDDAVDEMQVPTTRRNSEIIRPVTSRTTIPAARAVATASRADGSSTSLCAVVPS